MSVSGKICLFITQNRSFLQVLDSLMRMKQKAFEHLHLDVVVRVPVRVIDDDGVGGVEVDTETSGPGGQQEAELLGSFLVEPIDGVLSESSGDAAVDSLVLVALAVEEVLQEVQHLGHLGENEDSVALLLQLSHHLGHDDQLAASLSHGLDLKEAVRTNGGFFGGRGKEVRMVGHLLQLHHDVEERGLSSRLGPESLKVVSQNAFVELALHRSKVGSDDELGL